MTGEGAGWREAEALVDEVVPPAGPPGAPVARIGATVRELAAGLVEIGSLESLRLQQWIAAAVRRPQPHHRVVAVVAGKGGVGASTAAHAVATTLSALRGDTTALVRVHPPPAGGRPQTGRGLAATSLEASGLEVTNGGDPPTANDVFDLVDQLSNRHAFTVLDVGNDASAAAQAAVLCADQAIVVTGTGPESIEHARLALRRARGGRAASEVLAPIVAAVATMRGPARIRGTLTQQLGLGASRVVTIPYDRELARYGQFDHRTGRPTRGAFVTLAALVAVSPGGQPSR